MSFSQTIVEGFISRDSELRYTSTGVAVASTSIPVTEKWVDKAGQKQEKTTWYNLSVWGASGESFHKWAKKGVGMIIIGQIQEPKIYTNGKGEPATKLELKVSQWTFSSAKKDGNGHSDGPVHVEDGHEFQFVDPEAAAKIDW